LSLAGVCPFVNVGGASTNSKPPSDFQDAVFIIRSIICLWKVPVVSLGIVIVITSVAVDPLKHVKTTVVAVDTI
jgi:hypothetical protein